MNLVQKSIILESVTMPIAKAWRLLGSGYKVKSFKADTLLRGGQKAELHMRLANQLSVACEHL